MPLRAFGSALMHAVITSTRSPRNVFSSASRSYRLRTRNRSTANEFSPAERLGRGAYEPPRPGTLVPTDETVPTVSASGWPDDAHLGRCVSRRHDGGVHDLYKPAAGADSLDGWQDGSSVPSWRHPKRISVRGNKLKTALCKIASLAFNEAPARHQPPDQPNECRRHGIR